MGKALTGELSCPVTGLITFSDKGNENVQKKTICE